MKRKALLTLAVAVVMIAMFVSPVVAANFNLPAKPSVVGNDTQKGWATTGFEEEGAPADIDLDAFRKATALVLEVSKEPAGAGIQFILQTPAAWWQQKDYQVADVYADGKITLPFASDWKYDNDDFRGKIMVGYYDNGVDDLGITKAYIVYAGAGSGGKTGDGTMIALAIAALTLAAGSVVFFVRKVKA